MTLDPKSSASANSATPAYKLFNCCFGSRALRKAKVAARVTLAVPEKIIVLEQRIFSTAAPFCLSLNLPQAALGQKLPSPLLAAYKLFNCCFGSRALRKAKVATERQ